jgi:predicted amino acid racemase
LDPGDLRPKQEIAILGASSDHLIIDAGDSGVGMADEVAFILGYNSMMMAMTSPFVEKVYLGQEMARMG